MKSLSFLIRLTFKIVGLGVNVNCGKLRHECSYHIASCPSPLTNCPRLRSGPVCFASGCTSASLGDRVRRPSGAEVIISHELSGPRAEPRGPHPQPLTRGEGSTAEVSDCGIPAASQKQRLCRNPSSVICNYLCPNHNPMRLTLTALALLMSMLLNAQVPALIPYQAIARNAAGEPLESSTLNARFTIHDGTATGASVWQELQTVSTSALGLFTVQLGSSVALTNVNWATGAKFMQVEIDLGSGFVDIGTQQLLSVPYALHAGSVHLNVSATGDTLFVGDGSFVIVPGISEANSFTTGTTLHTCGAPNVHNPDLTYGSMTDQEGNVYKTIVIGTQEWMAENLNTSIYRNGDAIATNLDNAVWETTTSGAWSYYNDDASNACPYGKLYNWYTCVDVRGLCPVGWHVPSDDELIILITYLGSPAAGGKMKSAGILENGNGLWSNPNLGATNNSGFSGIPGGYRFATGGYTQINLFGYWWSSTDYGTGSSFFLYLNGNSVADGNGLDGHRDGFSVRCLRD